MIVDLAVVDDRAGLIVAEHRLHSVPRVDDRQAAVTEADIFIDKNAAVVRAAVT